MNKSYFNIGETVIVFNAHEWRKTGDLPEGNDKYYQEAKILNLRIGKYNEWLADVKFIKSGLRSNGHFTRCILNVG